MYFQQTNKALGALPQNTNFRKSHNFAELQCLSTTTSVDPLLYHSSIFAETLYAHNNILITR